MVYPVQALKLEAKEAVLILESISIDSIWVRHMCQRRVSCAARGVCGAWNLVGTLPHTANTDCACLQEVSPCGLPLVLCRLGEVPHYTHSLMSE